MEKTLKEVKFEKAWVCAMLTEIRDKLKKNGVIKASDIEHKGEEKWDTFTLLQVIEATLDNVGAEEAMAEQRAEQEAEYREWYEERGQYLLPKAKAPKGWK